MALHFAASLEYINHGQGASINNLDNQTWIFWCRPNSINLTNRRVAAKLVSGAERVVIYAGQVFSGSGDVYYFRDRAGTDSDVYSTGILTAGAWQFLAVVDGDGVTPRIYVGDEDTDVAEVGAYGNQQAGSGAPVDDSSGDLTIGSRATANTQSDWAIAYLWVYNRVLTLSEIAQHQYLPYMILSGCVLKAFYDDIDSLEDLSGNGNDGVVNGTPDEVANPDLTEGPQHSQSVVMG